MIDKNYIVHQMTPVTTTFKMHTAFKRKMKIFGKAYMQLSHVARPHLRMVHTRCSLQV